MRVLSWAWHAPPHSLWGRWLCTVEDLSSYPSLSKHRDVRLMALLLEAVPGSGWRPDGQQFVQVLKAISESFYPDSNASIRWEGPRYPGFAVNHSGVQADESLPTWTDSCVWSHRNQQDSVQGPTPMQPCHNTVTEEESMKRQWQG